MSKKTVKIKKVRKAIAKYMWSEGCSCCRDYEQHEKDAKVLGKLLNVPPYSDGEGHDFSKFKD